MRIDWRIVGFAWAGLVVMGLIWIGALMAETPPAPSADEAAPLFNERDAAAAFGDGETVSWRNDRGVRRVSFTPGGAGAYVATPDGGGLGGFMIFIPVDATPEEDYVVQIVVPNEDVASVGYSFVLHKDGEYRSTGMLPLDQTPPEARAFCSGRNTRWCEFRTGGNMIRYYRAAIYPQLIHEAIGEAQQ
jgi:hypothetical protein